MNKKKILAIVLVLLVILLGGASVYVATQLSSKQAVAPNAPTSKPKASEVCGTGLYCSVNNPSGSTACTLNGTETWCCPLGQNIVMGACVDIVYNGSDACTVTGVATAADCVPSGVVTCTPDCPTACGTAASTISTCTNSCEVATTKECSATAACAEAVDGDWSEWSACSATACGTARTRIRTCNNPTPANGGVECTKIDETLTTASARVETIACSAGSCSCVPTATLTCTTSCPTACGTAASSILCTNSCGADVTKACSATAACPTGTISPTSTVTVSPTGSVTAAATPTILPETGIFDLPGMAAFGGGLFLAVIGILLAL